eukprot:CAMPEP_0202071380 /NCGR_PEP_ID=MMETSP0964-20121228/1762_1 /ASSEMBLY_ACC=CAM_ASM_000500 /TAXON_ID=4773 /ORGANISM="Schizochytrium aggregatum, Strain ATCC28209" /LENGTH=32 /DNA_ID= /DNA_START= /DNA_END= /DNA_ORIENTATION=
MAGPTACRDVAQAEGTSSIGVEVQQAAAAALG